MKAKKILKLFLACCACIGLLHCQREALVPVNLSVMSSADDSAVPDSVRMRYSEDAARLALRELGKAGDLADAPVDLPGELVDSFYQALILVYNAVALPARKLVVEEYDIHTFRQPDLHSLILYVDSAQNWVQALRRGEPLTGNPHVDQLLQEFDLHISHDSAVLEFLVLYSKVPLNTTALAKRFSVIEGVRNAAPEVIGGSGNDIAAFADNAYLQLDYSLGFGDCRAFCTNHHFWKFRIYSNSLVEFVGEWGDPLP